MKKRIRIALDAMGGDYAPHTAVEGAVLAVRQYPVEVILVGNREAVMPHLRRLKAEVGGQILLHHTSQVVDMADNPLDVVRKKKDSSIRVALELVRDGSAEAFVSAGNSGAVASGGIFVLKRLGLIDRPVIAAILPTLSGPVVVADAGAVSTVKPFNLVQYAFMAAAYSRHLLQRPAPRIGLLSNGQEDSKGTEAVRDAGRLLKSSSLNYVGFVEGRDVFRNTVDVVVCDGFAGNVLLKTAEGVAESVAAALAQESRKDLLSLLGAWLSRRAHARLKNRFDYAQYGGAPLLGVSAPVIVAHGRSSALAIQNAIRTAMECAGSGIVPRISQELQASRELQSLGKKPSFIERVFQDMHFKRD